MTPKRKVLSILGVILSAALPLAAQTSKVKLVSPTSPSSGQAGLTSVNLAGSGFPSGTIPPSNVTITLTPAGGGNAVSTAATGVRTVVGSTRRITFVIPAGTTVSSATAYAVSISGTTSGGAAFQSGNTASLTVVPSASLVSVSPNAGIQGQTLTVTITAQYSNFAQGATQASFGPGISVNGGPEGQLSNVSVTSATTATATLVIDRAAATGSQTVSVQTSGAQQMSLSSGFTVNPLSVTVPQVSITSPAPLTVFNATGNPITVTGTVNNSQDTVSVNGVVAAVGGGAFTAQNVQLREGQNVIMATAKDPSGNVGTASETVTLNTTPPQLGILMPTDGATLMSSTVTVAGNVNEQVPGSINSKQVTVMVNGIAAAVSNSTFSAPNVPLVQGPNTITVSATDPAGNTAQAQIHVNYMGGIPIQKILKVSGDNQTGAIGSVLASPLVIEVVDSNGAAVPNQQVTFTVVKSDGILTSTTQQGQQVTLKTDQNGLASAQLQLGTRVGMDNDQVSVTSTGFVGQVTFSASASAGPAAEILVDMGDNQTGAVGQALPSPFVVIVLDSGGNPVPYTPVTFTVQQGGGTLNGNNTLAVSTDVNGMATAVLTLGQQEGVNNNVVSATFEGYTGQAASFVASGQVAATVSVTAISGLVEDDSSMPVPGATITLEGTTLKATSDQNGNFTLSPVPVGTFLMKVDGSTSTRADATFPFLVYTITTVAGLNNTLGMPVCLPPLDPTSVQNYDPTSTQPVILQMSGVTGYQFTVAPGSVTNPDGTPYSGPLSLSQVHADRVPMAPPNGTAPAMAGTLQPPGLHFNPPVAVQFPNTSGLAPGTVVDIYSYDHDQMAWVSQGPARVSADGSVIVSDPGFGISKSGWHFPPPPPPPKNCASACTSSNPCQTSTCVNGACQTMNVGDGTECDSGNSVCGKAYCKGGACVPSNNTDGMPCDPMNKCIENPMCKGGQCTGKMVDTSSWSDDLSLSADAKVPPDILSKINSVVQLIPGLGGVQFKEARVGFKGRAKNCCNKDTGIQTLGVKEGAASVQLTANVANIPLFGSPTITKEFDFTVVIISIDFEVGAFFTTNLRLNGEGGIRQDACDPNNNCLYGEANASLDPEIKTTFEAIACVESYWTTKACGGITITPLAIRASFRVGISYNKPNCGSGLQGFATLGRVVLRAEFSLDIPARPQRVVFEYTIFSGGGGNTGL